MKRISSIAVAASLLAGAAVIGTPAIAQKNKKQEAAAPAARTYDLSKSERAAIVPLQAAIQKKDMAAAAAALPAAQAAAKGKDAKFIVANLQLEIALAGTDKAAQAAAVEAMIASGGVEAGQLPRLYKALGSLYTELKQPDRAAAAYQKLAQVAPNDTDVMLMLAETEAKQNNHTQALAMLERAIAASTAAGQKPPEAWYRRAVKFAYDGKLPAQVLKSSRELVTAYPTAENWRDALTLYRQQAKLDKQAETDTLRLLRAAKAMKGDSDFFTLASNLNDAGLPGESKAVIDEGVQARLISPTKDYFRQLLTTTGGRVSGDRASLSGIEAKAMAAPNGKLALSTGEAFFGYGDYDKAASLFRTALQKGSIDTNVANTRLGMALALAGKKAEAEAAFRAVTGPRADLAGYWLLWLSQRG